MDLRILNTNLEAIAIVDAYESFIWSDRYYEYGDFELYMAMDSTLLDFLRKDYYIQIRESDHLIIIEDLKIESDAEEGNRLTVTGRSLESILDRRVVWGQKTLSGSLQNAIKTLINESIISPSITDRKIPNFIFEDSTDTAITSLNIDAQYTGDNLYDVVNAICTESSIGFQITLNDSNQFVFKLYSGIDRSYEQTAVPYVIFSPKFDNIVNSNYFESNASLKNVALVGGEDTSQQRKYVTVGSGTGLSRREMFVDARDIRSEVDGKALSTSEYNAQLQQRGKEKLAENIEIMTFEGEADTTTMFKYGTDFFNGDIVQVANEYGHETKSRIVEITISDDEGGFSIYPTFKTENGEEVDNT